MTAGMLVPPDAAGRMPRMDTDETSPKPRQRRPQAERSADTRAKLIQAAITCLDKTGYSATTVSTVAEEAGVSRGAMTHQFPAKTDLMVAVVEAVFLDDSDMYNRSVAEMDPIDWLFALPETMWRVISRPSGIAVMEIMLASRSDADLAEKLSRAQTQIDTRAHKWSGDRIRAAGIEPHPESEAIHELYVAAVRGLALEAVLSRNTLNVKRSLAVLTEMTRQLYPELARKRPRKKD
jgi:AcrR family transcriptional regulator